jgi:hypothetical protein
MEADKNKTTGRNLFNISECSIKFCALPFTLNCLHATVFDSLLHIVFVALASFVDLDGLQMQLARICESKRFQHVS